MQAKKRLPGAMGLAPAMLALAGVLWLLPTAGLAQWVRPTIDAAPASAAPGERALALSSLAATCASCHGTNGVSAPGASITSLAGMDQGYIAQQMKAFKSGARPATVMHQLSQGYNDAQIDALAGYFAAQPKPP